jgi:hypothetical protein
VPAHLVQEWLLDETERVLGDAGEERKQQGRRRDACQVSEHHGDPRRPVEAKPLTPPGDRGYAQPPRDPHRTLAQEDAAHHDLLAAVVQVVAEMDRIEQPQERAAHEGIAKRRDTLRV